MIILLRLTDWLRYVSLSVSTMLNLDSMNGLDPALPNSNLKRKMLKISAALNIIFDLSNQKRNWHQMFDVVNIGHHLLQVYQENRFAVHNHSRVHHLMDHRTLFSVHLKRFRYQ